MPIMRKAVGALACLLAAHAAVAQPVTNDRALDQLVTIDREGNINLPEIVAPPQPSHSPLVTTAVGSALAPAGPPLPDSSIVDQLISPQLLESAAAGTIAATVTGSAAVNPGPGATNGTLTAPASLGSHANAQPAARAGIALTAGLGGAGITGATTLRR